MQILKENIRDCILKVARQQFEQKGYSKTSMREIAESAGVGVGNIYNYFTNKDDLFREVVRPVLYALEAMLQEHHGIRGSLLRWLLFSPLISMYWFPICFIGIGRCSLV